MKKLILLLFVFSSITLSAQLPVQKSEKWIFHDSVSVDDGFKVGYKSGSPATSLYYTRYNQLGRLFYYNDLTPATGMLLKGNGTYYDNFAKGTAGQFLKVNAAGTDLEWRKIRKADLDDLEAYQLVFGNVTDNGQAEQSDGALLIPSTHTLNLGFVSGIYENPDTWVFRTSTSTTQGTFQPTSITLANPSYTSTLGVDYLSLYDAINDSEFKITVEDEAEWTWNFPEVKGTVGQIPYVASVAGIQDNIEFISPSGLDLDVDAFEVSFGNISGSGNLQTDDSLRFNPTTGFLEVSRIKFMAASGIGGLYYGSERFLFAQNHNSALGGSAGNFTWSGDYNTVNGYESGNAITTASYNSYFGAQSGKFHTTGANNTFLGAKSGGNNLTGANNLFIGYSAGENETGSNKLYIDVNNSTTPLIYGDFSTDELTVNGTAFIRDVALNATALNYMTWNSITKEVEYREFPFIDANEFVFGNSSSTGYPQTIDEFYLDYPKIVHDAVQIQITNSALGGLSWYFGVDEGAQPYISSTFQQPLEVGTQQYALKETATKYILGGGVSNDIGLSVDKTTLDVTIGDSGVDETEFINGMIEKYGGSYVTQGNVLMGTSLNIVQQGSIIGAGGITVTTSVDNQITIDGGAAGGGGTVTSFSATDNTTFDFTVTNPTTTPDLTATLKDRDWGDATLTSSGTVLTIDAGAVTNAKLANSTISGISLGSNLNDLTIGTNLQLSSGTTYNGGTAKTISLQNAAADGATKGAAGFLAADFNDASGIISIDYANGQAATSGQDGFLQSADWSTFNNKGYTVTANGTQGTLVDGSTYYSGMFGTTTTNAANNRVPIPVSGTITDISIYMITAGTLSSGESSTLAVRYDNTTDVIVSSAVLNSAMHEQYTVSGLSQSVTAGHYLELKYTAAAWATNPTNVRWACVVYIK